MPDAPVLLRPFEAPHIGAALRLSQAVGWPHRAEDWAQALALSQGVVAMQGREVVGTALCTRFDDVAMLNMIIVDARLRGQGIGRQLMADIMAMAGAREMRLVATRDGLPLYERLGFVRMGGIVQVQGPARPVPAPSLPVRIGGPADLAQVVAMDRAAGGVGRARLLEGFLQAGAWLFLAGNGFAVLRAFGRGHLLGPVVADSSAVAQALILAGAATVPAGALLRIDMPARAAAACAPALAASGLVQVGDEIAMHRNPRPRPPPALHRYALASQAHG